MAGTTRPGPATVSEALALVALAAALLAALAAPRFASGVAVAGALALVATASLSGGEIRSELHELGPTVGFLAALLLLADGCRRAGLFAFVGGLMARRAGSDGRFLLVLVFAAAAVITAVLSLDATVVLLTPVVLAAAARLRAPSRPFAVACVHLANSASLLLPVSNLTNLLASHASGLSFIHFAALMALPWLAAVAVEWLVLSRWFTRELRAPLTDIPHDGSSAPTAPRAALVVVALTLAGFVLSSPLGVAPVWSAAAGALALALRAPLDLRGRLAAAQPAFLIFVLALAVIVRAASDHGLGSVVDQLVPAGHSLLSLLAIAGVGALVANLLNNLPATLILLPTAAHGGAASILALLIGVGIGPNLLPVGSLATLLWRRVLAAHDQRASTRQLIAIGLVSVPAGLVAATVMLWLAVRLV